MGEMIIGEEKEHVSVVMVRPTIITSTFREPFPGWVEGVRTIDSLAVGYAKGKLSFFLGDLKAVVDAVLNYCLISFRFINLFLINKIQNLICRYLLTWW